MAGRGCIRQAGSHLLGEGPHLSWRVPAWAAKHSSPVGERMVLAQYRTAAGLSAGLCRTARLRGRPVAPFLHAGIARGLQRSGLLRDRVGRRCRRYGAGD
jgi:hypothetical protein